MRLLLLCLTVSLGCSSVAIPPHRFANEPIVTRVNDRVHTPVRPKKNNFRRNLYQFNRYTVHSVTRALDVPVPTAAQDTNALDELPDSTWFTNRIDTMSAQDVYEGPGISTRGPDPSGPWRVLGTKAGGKSIGFNIEDKHGDRYILKFDPKGFANSETAAHVVVHRLLYAAGFHVAQDSIVTFERSQLRLAPDAEEKTAQGKMPLTQTRLSELLDQVEGGRSPSIRGITSLYLAGKPLGGHPDTGTRSDDPNDLVDHENMRVLRGLYGFAAWVANTDIKQDNFLDMYVTDSDDNETKYVAHYMLDFGMALGNHGWIERYEFDGYAYRVDASWFMPSLFGLGLYKRPWEDRHYGPAGTGMFSHHNFDPGAFRPVVPYTPFSTRDPVDDFWSARIIMKFTPAHIEHAVAAAKYPDPRVADYMAETLNLRRLAIGKWAFARVSPLDNFRVPEGQSSLCFDDLWMSYGFAIGGSSYVIEAFDDDSRRLSQQTVAATGPRSCVGWAAKSGSAQQYTVVRLRARRNAQTLPPVDVHLALEPGTEQLRVVGVRRGHANRE